MSSKVVFRKGKARPKAPPEVLRATSLKRRGEIEPEDSSSMVIDDEAPNDEFFDEELDIEREEQELDSDVSNEDLVAFMDDSESEGEEGTCSSEERRSQAQCSDDTGQGTSKPKDVKTTSKQRTKKGNRGVDKGTSNVYEIASLVKTFSSVPTHLPSLRTPLFANPEVEDVRAAETKLQHLTLTERMVEDFHRQFSFEQLRKSEDPRTLCRRPYQFGFGSGSRTRELKSEAGIRSPAVLFLLDPVSTEHIALKQGGTCPALTASVLDALFDFDANVVWVDCSPHIATSVQFDAFERTVERLARSIRPSIIIMGDETNRIFLRCFLSKHQLEEKFRDVGNSTIVGPLFTSFDIHMDVMIGFECHPCCINYGRHTSDEINKAIRRWMFRIEMLKFLLTITRGSDRYPTGHSQKLPDPTQHKLWRSTTIYPQWTFPPVGDSLQTLWKMRHHEVQTGLPIPITSMCQRVIGFINGSLGYEIRNSDAAPQRIPKAGPPSFVLDCVAVNADKAMRRPVALEAQGHRIGDQSPEGRELELIWNKNKFFQWYEHPTTFTEASKCHMARMRAAKECTSVALAEICYRSCRGTYAVWSAHLSEERRAIGGLVCRDHGRKCLRLTIGSNIIKTSDTCPTCLAEGIGHCLIGLEEAEKLKKLPPGYKAVWKQAINNVRASQTRGRYATKTHGEALSGSLAGIRRIEEICGLD